jgi:hypothetical protein
LPVKIIHHHATSKRFEALIDTGTDYCIFDAMIGASIGIKIDNVQRATWAVSLPACNQKSTSTM